MALPLACWDGEWGFGTTCLRPGRRTPLEAVCHVPHAARKAVRVAVPADASEVAFVEPDDDLVFRLSVPPEEGRGVEIAPEAEALLAAALGRDLVAAPPPLFIVRQSTTDDFAGDGRKALLLNVRVFLPGDDATERHALYLFSDGRFEDGEPPILLRSTSGASTTETLTILATTDLDQDGRRELVLATSDHVAPVETSLVLMEGKAAQTLAKVSCTAAGIEFSTPR